jgi:hypothetical protein
VFDVLAFFGFVTLPEVEIKSVKKMTIMQSEKDPT